MKLPILLGLVISVTCLACATQHKQSSTTPSPQPVAVTTPVVDTSLTLGRQLFGFKCEGCHNTYNDAPDLKQTKFTLDDVKHIVFYGKRQMPSFQEELSSSEIEAIAKYCISLQGQR